MNRITLLWNRLLYTLWFIPSLIILVAALLAVGLVELSGRVDDEVLQRWPRLFGASAGSSRDMLAAIAGSMITVAGVTFSITVVAVTQASIQFTPRILRNFMRDRPSQVVLGGLSGVFTYCLVVLRTIRGGEASPYIPSIAVLAAFVLAAVGVGLLIYFVHHIAMALQASTIIARVNDDTAEAIDEMFPADVGVPAEETAPSLDLLQGVRWTTVASAKSGYVQNVDPDALLNAAVTHDLVVRMERGVGEFVAEGSPLVSVAHPGTAPPDEAGADILATFTIGAYRTVEQDPGYGIRQLADIALKGLSPGINDPTTALNCIDYLGAVMARAARRGDVARWRTAHGKVRVIARGPSFESLLDASFDEIRRYAEGHPAVLLRQLDALETVGRSTRTAARRRHVAMHVDLIAEAAERTVQAPSDRGAVLIRAGEVRAAAGAG